MHTRLSRAIATAALSIGLLFGGTAAPPPAMAASSQVNPGATRVTTTKVNLRKGAGVSYGVIRVVSKGSRVTLTGRAARGFNEVVTGSSTGWMSSRYLVKKGNPLPAVIGTRYATGSLTIRSTSTANFTRVAVVPRGTTLSITGVVRNTRMLIIYKNTPRWVTAKYLSRSKPSGSSPASKGVEKGLKPNAVKSYRAVITRFPQIKTVYGVRKSATPDHPAGRAIDVMIPHYTSAAGKNLGGQIAAWSRVNAKALGIHYVIWNQKIWNVRRDKDGWRPMAGRGNDSANHKDHVHITVY